MGSGGGEDPIEGRVGVQRQIRDRRQKPRGVITFAGLGCMNVFKTPLVFLLHNHLIPSLIMCKIFVNCLRRAVHLDNGFYVQKTTLEFHIYIVFHKRQTALIENDSLGEVMDSATPWINGYRILGADIQQGNHCTHKVATRRGIEILE